MSAPIEITAPTLKAICTRLTAHGAHRSDNALLHHVLIVRGEGRVLFAVTDLLTAAIYCHLPAPLPITAFQRKLLTKVWQASALRFLAPLADLRDASRDPRGTVTITPGELYRGPTLTNRYATPDVDDFPPILPALASIEPGWTTREIHLGRVDIAALAAESWE